MTQHNTHRSRLAYGWVRGEDYWGDPLSDNMLKTDMLLHPFVISMSVTMPPTINTPGDMYIVAPGGTSAWAGHDNHLAIMGELGWYFFTPYKGVTVRAASPGGRHWWNGEQWLPDAIDTPGTPIEGTRYDISVSVGYEAEPREVLAFIPVPQAMTIPVDGTGSTAKCMLPPVLDTFLSIRRNGTEVGTITFSMSNITGTIQMPQSITFGLGDDLTIVMPDNPPAGFENYGVVLRMTLVDD